MGKFLAYLEFPVTVSVYLFIKDLWLGKGEAILYTFAVLKLIGGVI